MEKNEQDQLIIQIKDWGKRLSEHQLPKYPDRQQVAEFVEMCGGNLEAIKGHEKSMQKWTVAGMAEAMEAVWTGKWEEVQSWNEDWIKDYETRTGRTLPHINVYKKGTREVARITKQAPMKHFLGLITRWAAFNDEQDPEFNEKRFFDEINVRVLNGFLRQEGATTSGLTGSIERPDTGEIYHPSLPPEYPLALIDHLILLQK